VKVSLAARKNLAVERHKRVVHFGKFVIRDTNMELGQYLHQEKNKRMETFSVNKDICNLLFFPLDQPHD